MYTTSTMRRRAPAGTGPWFLPPLTPRMILTGCFSPRLLLPRFLPSQPRLSRRLSRESAVSRRKENGRCIGIVGICSSLELSTPIVVASSPFISLFHHRSLSPSSLLVYSVPQIALLLTVNISSDSVRDFASVGGGEPPLPAGERGFRK